MSEEEKQAINFIKELAKKIPKFEESESPYFEGKVKRVELVLIEEDYNIFKVLLNLIDKQHKEIYRLQEENKTLKEQIHYEEAKSSNKDILRLWRRK